MRHVGGAPVGAQQLDATKIHAGLWMGGAPPGGRAVADAGFRVLVLCALEHQPPDCAYPDVELVRVPYDDAEGHLPVRVLKKVFGAAEVTAQRVATGRPVLVTCYAGRNRSGLVTALALSLLTGEDPARCGEIVRAKRGPLALTNGTFVDVLNTLRGEDCDLCAGARVTTRHHEDPLCWIADCSTCRVPMVVLRRHSIKPTEDEKRHMLKLLEAVADGQLGRGAYRVTTDRRTVKDHWHAHARPAKAR